LKAWGVRLAKTEDIAARSLPWRASWQVILHRMWIDGSEFRWGSPASTVE
jgi:hypothetical protein